MMFYDFSALDTATLCRAVGILGFALYVTAFLGLSIGRLNSRDLPYFCLVCLAACCVLISLCVDFNLSAAMIQIFYIMMSMGAIRLRWRNKPEPPNEGFVPQKQA